MSAVIYNLFAKLAGSRAVVGDCWWKSLVGEFWLGEIPEASIS